MNFQSSDLHSNPVCTIFSIDLWFPSQWNQTDYLSTVHFTGSLNRIMNVKYLWCHLPQSRHLIIWNNSFCSRLQFKHHTWQSERNFYYPTSACLSSLNSPLILYPLLPLSSRNTWNSQTLNAVLVCVPPCLPLYVLFPWQGRQNFLLLRFPRNLLFITEHVTQELRASFQGYSLCLIIR